MIPILFTVYVFIQNQQKVERYDEVKAPFLIATHKDKITHIKSGEYDLIKADKDRIVIHRNGRDWTINTKGQSINGVPIVIVHNGLIGYEKGKVTFSFPVKVEQITAYSSGVKVDATYN